MFAGRPLHSCLLISACTAMSILVLSCDEDCAVCPADGTSAPSGWFEQTLPSGDAFYGLQVFDSSTVIAVGDQGVIIKTTDGGETWARIESGTVERLSGVSFANESTGWVAGTHSVLLKTTDGGESWSPQTTGVTTHFRDVCFVDENTGWVVGAPWGTPNMDGYIIKTTDGGETWATQLAIAGGTVCFVDADSGFVGTGDGVQRTTDGGETWTLLDLSAPGWLGSFGHAGVDSVWVAGWGGFLALSTDGGATWSIQNDGTDRTINDVCFVTSARGWYIALGTIAATTDGGETWLFQACPTTSGLRRVSFANENIGWIVGYDGVILKTVTGGAFR